MTEFPNIRKNFMNHDFTDENTKHLIPLPLEDGRSASYHRVKLPWGKNFLSMIIPVLPL